MIKTIFRITAALLFLFGMPILIPVEARPNSEEVNDNVLLFVGSARRHLRLNDSIDAALHDAARKVAFFHSVSGEIVTHESSGALVGNTFVVHSEINDTGDYVRYLDKLEYNRKTDVFESDNTVFVHARYHSTSIINIGYTPVQNNEKPWWIDNPPSKIGSYSAAVGFSAARLYHNDTVVVSYENAIISLIESSVIGIRIIESETGISNNSSSISIASGTLTGFFVLDTWTDPITKSVWTLAIAGGFTENKTAPDNAVSGGSFNASVPYQMVPAQFFPNPPIPDNWTTHLPGETETMVYFWGFSGKSKDRREAETQALQDAKLRVSGYIQEIVEGKEMDATHYKKERGHIVHNSEIFNTSSWSYTQNILEGVKPIISHSVSYSDGSMEIQILVSVFKDDINRKRDEIDQRMMNLSVYYTSEIKKQASSSLETLRKYGQIAAQLSPLERLKVNYLGFAEPVNLYAYLTDQIGKLSHEIYIAPGTKEYFIGTWVATVEHKIKRKRSFDTYQINLSASGDCMVKITNDKAQQETTGIWSLDGSMFALKAEFDSPAITYQRNIDWVYPIGFGEGNNAFYILGRAATNGPLVRFAFLRQSDY